MTIKETAHYKLYENIVLAAPANFGIWTKTHIHIPERAIVAVMVKGEVWDITDRGKWHWQPYQCLRFKVGKGGIEAKIVSGTNLRNPSNLNVVPSGGGGLLHFGMSTWWSEIYPETKRGKFVVRVIVWEKGREDQIEADLLELIRTHPGDQQFRDLVAIMAFCLRHIGEFEKVVNLGKMMREAPGIDWGGAFPLTLVAMSEVETLFGRYERARTYAEEALINFKRYDNKWLESWTLFHLGTAASFLGQYEEANRFLEESLKISNSLKNPYLIGLSLYGIGQNLLRMNKPEEAIKHLNNALEFCKKSDTNFAPPYWYLSLGISYTRLNKTVEAKESFESAIKIGAKVASPDVQWRAYGWLGWITEKEGDNQKAFEHYAKAISIIESMRAKFLDPGLKVLFMKDKSNVYERMIQLLYKMQRIPEALHYLERARARVILDMLAEKTLSSKNREENELLNQEQALRKQIDEISMRQEEIGFERPPERENELLDTQELKEPISELERLQSQHRAILDKIEKLNSELASLVSINPLKASEIQGLLDPDTALLAYFLGQKANFVFMATREKVLANPLGTDREKLFQKIREFRTKAVEEIAPDWLKLKTYEKSLSELYEMLIQPIEREISGKRHLVIVSHGMLHYLPFQALLSREGRYLIESFTISYLPSASVLKYARVKNNGNRVDLFAVGNPVTDLPPLPGAEIEAQEVSALFEKKLLLTGRQATKTSMKSQSPKYDLLHLSTHGEMIESNPLRSNLRFTPSKNDDGKLTVSEIFDMQIKANLVTLSACETALVRSEAGDFPQGDDLVGLSRAFIHAGAPSVVASLWKVSDESTVEFMRAFYGNLKNMSKSEALQRAQLDLMKSGICFHPYFWAPFILLGDWR
jgi:CHAT domain-containing protein